MVLRSERGASLVEFAMTLPLFLLALALLIETSLALYRIAAIEQVVSITARDTALGVTDPGLGRLDTIKQRLRTRGRNLSITVNQNEITVCRGVNINCAPQDAGGPGDFVSISARIPLTPLILRSFNYRSSVTVRNERF